MFIEIPFPIKKEGLHIQPAGKYIRAFYKESAENAAACYQKIFDYAEKHGLTLSGFSYEIIINENVIDRIEDYIVQIEIPCSPSFASTGEAQIIPFSSLTKAIYCVTIYTSRIQ